MSRSLFASESPTPRGSLGLSPIFCRRADGLIGRPGRTVDLGDCLVERPKPWRLAVWEPLATKAPSPALAKPYCCYIQTVIFYHRPYVLRLARRYYRSRKGGSLRLDGKSYEQWDQIETRLHTGDVVSFEDELFDLEGGRVVWGASPGGHRRWWMEHSARRRAA